MGEISNKTLALLVLAALVVVVVATTVQLNALSGLGGLTGFATSDTGDVNLSIGTSLAIEVDTTYDYINFGTCTPNASGSYTVNSNDTFANSNCTGDLGSAQRIQVNNVGNVVGNVTVTGECSNSAWLPETAGSTNAFQVAFDAGTGNCTSNLRTTYTDLETAELIACENLTIGGSINMSAQVVIDTDTQSTGACGGDTENQITFNAYILS